MHQSPLLDYLYRYNFLLIYKFEDMEHRIELLFGLFWKHECMEDRIELLFGTFWKHDFEWIQ